MPPLSRTVPIAEGEHSAGSVADDLHLDMAGPGQETLQVHPPIPERRRGLTVGACEQLGQLVGGGGRPACRCLRRRRSL